MKRKSLTKSIRFKVLRRDGFRCQYCGETSGNATLVVDHVYPAAKGGTDNIDNLVTSCTECNYGKGTKTIDGLRDIDRETLKALQNIDGTLLNLNNRLSAVETLIKEFLNIAEQKKGNNNNLRPQNSLSEWIGTKEAAEILGCKPSTITQLTHYKKIPFYKPAKHLRFKRNDILEYIEQKKFEKEDCEN